MGLNQILNLENVLQIWKVVSDSLQYILFVNSCKSGVPLQVNTSLPYMTETCEL